MLNSLVSLATRISKKIMDSTQSLLKTLQALTLEATRCFFAPIKVRKGQYYSFFVTPKKWKKSSLLFCKLLFSMTFLFKRVLNAYFSAETSSEKSPYCNVVCLLLRPDLQVYYGQAHDHHHVVGCQQNFFYEYVHKEMYIFSVFWQWPIF